MVETTPPTAWDQSAMKLALEEARQAANRGEVPVGAVLVGSDGRLLAADGNRTIELSDPSAHAEMLALRSAAKALGNYRLTGTTLYVTLEPCVMCAAAMVHARIGRLVFGAEDPKGGGVVSLFGVGSDPRLNHCFKVEGGLMAIEGAQLLRDFFSQRRAKAKTGW